MRRKDDLIWKSILEDVFADFLRFMSPDAEEILDFDRGFEFLDKELQEIIAKEGDGPKAKEVDKLVKVFTKTGKEEFVLVHIEIQNVYKTSFAKRMLNYHYLVWRKYDKPITAYAIFTESILKDRPNTFETNFLGTSLKYVFNTYKIARQNVEELAASTNLFSQVVLIAKTAMEGKGIKDSLARDELLLDLKLKLVKHLRAKDIAKEKVRALINFLRFYVLFENEEISIKFEEQTQVLNENSTTMGIEEYLLDKAETKGKALGMAQRSYEVVKNLILKLGLSDKQIADVAEVTIAEVKKIRLSLNK